MFYKKSKMDEYLNYTRMYFNYISERCDYAEALKTGIGKLPQPEAFIDLEDRFVGALVGLAIGDAMARPVESMTAEMIKEKYGEIKNYMVTDQKWHPAEIIRAGGVSDDTQMSLDVAKCLIENGYLNPDRQLAYTNSYMIKGAGNIVLRALHYYRHGIPWYLCGINSDFNGGAMRPIPVGLFNFKSPEKLKIDAILSCWTTHTNAKAVAGTIAQAYSAAYLVNVNMDYFAHRDNMLAFIESIISSIEGIECSGGVYEKKTVYFRIKNELANMLDQCEDPAEMIRIWGNGVNVVESISNSLYYFLKSPQDFEKILLTATNAGGDNDSIASMACGLSGALVGFSNIPGKYVEGLENHEGIIKVARDLYRASMDAYEA